MSDDIEKRFGQVLKQLRQERGFTQQELAEASGCHRSHISFMERGIKAPTLPMLFQLATALQISPAILISRIEDDHHLLP